MGDEYRLTTCSIINCICIQFHPQLDLTFVFRLSMLDGCFDSIHTLHKPAYSPSLPSFSQSRVPILRTKMLGCPGPSSGPWCHNALVLSIRSQIWSSKWSHQMRENLNAISTYLKIKIVFKQLDL